MVPGEYIEKHGGVAIIATSAMLGVTWILGYWHNWSELNFRLIFLFFSIAVGATALLKWFFHLATNFFKSDIN